MNNVVLFPFLDATSADWLKLAIDIGLKSSLLIAAFGLVAFFMKRSTASFRALIWLAALSLVLLLPVAHMISPIVHVPIIPNVGANADAVLQIPAATSDYSPKIPMQSIPLNWPLIIWLSGAALLTFWILLGKIGALLLITRADRVQSISWIQLSQELQRELGIEHRKVRLVHHDIVTMAMTTGIKKPTIVLPRSANSWSPARRRLVLLHELAHIKRRDTLFETLAELALIIYWFNPLVWLAVSRFRIERERACDDCVINTGARASDYAWQLMNIAASAGPKEPSLRPVASVSLRSHFKDRLMSILDPAVKRQNPGPATGIILLVPMVVIAFSLAAISPWQTRVRSETGDQPHAAIETDLDAYEIVENIAMGNSSERRIAMRSLDERWKSEPELLVMEALNLAGEANRNRAIDVLAGKSKPDVLRILMEIYRYDNMCTRSIDQYNRLTNRKTQGNTLTTVSQHSSD